MNCLAVEVPFPDSLDYKLPPHIIVHIWNIWKVVVVSCRKFIRKFWAYIFTQSKVGILFCQVYSSIWVNYFMVDFHILDAKKGCCWRFKLTIEYFCLTKIHSTSAIYLWTSATFFPVIRPPLYCSQCVNIQQLNSSEDPFGSFAPGMLSSVSQTEAKMFLLTSEGSAILNKNNSCPSSMGLLYNCPLVNQNTTWFWKSYIVMV